MPRLEALTGFHLHRGALAAMARLPLSSVGSLVSGDRPARSRIAILDPLYRRAIRVSMGTVFQVPWTRIESWPEGLDELRQAGYVVAGMTLGEGVITLDEMVAEDHQNLALVFGTEGHGLTSATDRQLDRRVTIPMMGDVDSLNVAASSAVAFYATR